MRRFAGLTPADIAAAVAAGTARADAVLDSIVGEADALDARGVVERLDRVARHALDAYGPTALWMVHPDDAVREAASAAVVRHEAWRSATFARADLHRVLAALDVDGLHAPDRRLLELWRGSQRTAGAHLDEAGRAELERLHARASELAMAVSTAFTGDLPVLELHRDELDGLDEGTLGRLEPGTAPGTLRVPVDYQTRDAFLTGVRRRDVRETFWRRLQDRGRATALEQMRELFDIRREIARLTGASSWASLRTATGAVGSVAAADAVLDDVASSADRATRAFVAACEAVLADELRGEPFQPWDQFRGLEALTTAVGADREPLRAYLTVEATAVGLFDVVRRVFGIRVEPGEPGLGWHDDVRTLRLLDDATGELLGVCLWDPWDRPGKMAGTVAFMDLLEADPPGDDGAFPPAVTMLVTMFPKPADGADAHLSVGDVEVLFHEFGHVLDVTVGSRRSVVLDDAWWGRDWVEGPSFSLGSWGRSPEVIATFARHPETGDPVAASLVEPLALAQAIEDVPYVARYLHLGRIDLLVHGAEPVDLDDAWRRASATSPLPDPLGAFHPFPLSMIAGGYDGALYGVVYALTIRDELLGAFARVGWLDPAIGRRYVRDVLGPGAFVPPVERLTAFLGHAPSSRPLAERLEQAVEAVGRGATPASSSISPG